MPIQDYSTDPDLNVQISGINIAEGCPPSGINNAIRQLMADVKVESEAQAEAITAAGEALAAFAGGQAAKDDEQDEAITSAKGAVSELSAELVEHGGLANYAKDVGAADANAILSPGIYWLRSTSTNIPSGTNGLLQVFELKGLILRQVFWRHGTINSNDHNIWTRQIKLTGSDGIDEIGDWVQILTGKGGTIKSTVPRLYFSDTDITKGTAPSATHALGMAFKDVAGTDGGTLLYSVYANGGTKLELSAYNWMGSGSAALGVCYGAEQGPYGYAPTPLAESNTNDIATTAWVRARSKWTYKDAVLHDAAKAVGEYQLDFSSYLPADGEEYEVLLSVYGSASADTSTNSVFRLYTPGNTLCMQVEAEGKNFEQANGSMVFPISSTRVVKYTVTGTSFDDTLRIRVAGYRKA